MKKVFKFILLGLGLAVITVGFSGCIFFRIILGSGIRYNTSNVEQYLNHECRGDFIARNVMPKIEELSNYEDIEYRFTEMRGIFPWASYALIVKYNDDTYESEKNKICEDYKFIKENVKAGDVENEYVIDEPYFSINSYDFRAVSDEKDLCRDYPKFFGLIGMSDEKNSIAYLYYCDSELDYIDNIEEFVEEHFCYDF